MLQAWIQSYEARQQHPLERSSARQCAAHGRRKRHEVADVHPARERPTGIFGPGGPRKSLAFEALRSELKPPSAQIFAKCRMQTLATISTGFLARDLTLPRLFHQLRRANSLASFPRGLGASTDNTVGSFRRTARGTP